MDTPTATLTDKEIADELVKHVAGECSHIPYCCGVCHFETWPCPAYRALAEVQRLRADGISLTARNWQLAWERAYAQTQEQAEIIRELAAPDAHWIDKALEARAENQRLRALLTKVATQDMTAELWNEVKRYALQWMDKDRRIESLEAKVAEQAQEIATLKAENLRLITEQEPAWLERLTAAQEQISPEEWRHNSLEATTYILRSHHEAHAAQKQKIRELEKALAESGH